MRLGNPFALSLQHPPPFPNPTLPPQAIPYAWTLLFIPMHFLTHELLLFATAIWTTNIHDNIHGKVGGWDWVGGVVWVGLRGWVGMN